MNTGYKINGVDIEQLFESFPIEIAQEYGVTDSLLTASEYFKKNNISLKQAINKVFPTSSGNCIGGSNVDAHYKVLGSPIDISLKGCRPIGIPIARLEVGTHYVNRVNGVTWLSSSPNSATGIKLEYNPKYLHVELLGGGGGGAGSSSVYASSGGGGGGYCYTTLVIPDNSFVKLIVGAKGNGGNARENGYNGGDSKIELADGSVLCIAMGGQGGKINNDGLGEAGRATGGIVNISGGNGGLKENYGSGIEKTIVNLNKPESTYWIRGGTSGGSSLGNNFGGGGGASAFSNGANANSNTTPAAAEYGAGGAGAGFKAVTASLGGDGGNGLINLYY